MGAVLIAIAVVFLPRMAAAMDILGQAAKYGVADLDAFHGASVPAIMGNIISALLSLVGAIFFVMFIWGGVNWLWAGGDSEKVKKAQKALTNAVIGLIIVAASYAIVTNIVSLIAAGAKQ